MSWSRRSPSSGSSDGMPLQSPADLEEYLRAHIPLAAAMDVSVEQVQNEIVLQAPLEPNLNHRETAFGGSVAAMAILAGWSWTHTRLRAHGRDAHCVIQTSEVQYDRPIASTFRTRCDGVTEDEWGRFLRTLDRRGKARLRLEVTIECEGTIAGSFAGAFVALAR